MVISCRSGARALIALLVSVSLLGGSAALARERTNRHVSEILTDASTGTLLFAKSPDAIHHPASLTKMMTLYLAFEALEAGHLKLSDPVLISARAARQPPSRLGISIGACLTVKQALRAIAVLSANDVAVALAERLAANEQAFARVMTVRAHQLGMVHTKFANATGLPGSGNVTTARDMATLSRALLRQFPQRYSLFGTRSIHWRQRTIANHNHLLGKVPGVDGIKTGYTADAGYNLAASARRGGKRVIAIVLGEQSVSARDVRVANLVQLGFDTPGGSVSVPRRPLAAGPHNRSGARPSNRFAER